MAETIKNVVAQVNGIGPTVPLIIGGEEKHPEKAFDVINPFKGQVAHKCGAASTKDAEAAIDAAARAFPAWSKTTPKKRRDIFLKATQIIDKRYEELSRYMMEETGCPQDWADFNLGVSKDFFTDVAGKIGSIVGTVPTTQDEDTGALILKEPYGVVLAIAPWNGPYILGTRAIAFPIAAGNTVVFKGTELSPRCMWALCDILREAGLPDGVLNFLVAAPEDAGPITQAIIAHPAVKKINFTGSTGVGRIIARVAGENLKPLLLELGGKAPAIVWEDADLENAATQCALGSFINSGQICMSTEKILVHKNVKAEFERKLAEKTGQIFGNAQVLIHEAAAEKNRTLIHDAVSKGAKLVYGDKDAIEESKTRMRPFIVSGVQTNMDLYKTESFGPSVSLYEIETEEEALRLANDTEYGLSSAVFTEDLRRGLRLAKGIEAGAVHINSMTVHDESVLPHGGAKASGYGRFNATALDEWVRSKSITYKF